MSSNFYSAPSYMTGGFTIYGGYRRQRGAGIFGSFRKIMAPIGRQAISGLKKVAQNKTVQDIAKKAAAKGAEVLTGVAVDALQGRNIGESFKERGRDVALRTLTGQAPAPTSVAPSRKRKRSKSVRKKLKQRKRLPPARELLKPPAKRRRHSVSRAKANRKNLF